MGILRLPAGTGPHPTVILIPGLDSTKEEFREVERAFLDRGMATFALDGPGQGEVEWTLPIRPDWEVVGEAVLEHLSNVPEVDLDRIGVWGVSLGGYYAARLASRRPPDPGDHRVVGSLQLRRRLGQSQSPDPTRLRGPFVFDQRRRGTDARAHELTMEGRAANISRPLLVVMGKRDRLFPYSDAERLVAESGPTSELLLLEDGNHGCANVSLSPPSL